MFTNSQGVGWGNSDARVRFGVIASLISILTILISAAAPGRAHATVLPSIRHVVVGGLSSGACDTWGNACNLQYALGIAVSSDQVWVEQGTYTPGTLRTDSFNLKNGVSIYGGFAGSETDLSQRSIWTHLAILSGEIGDPGLTLDNSYHVVVGSGTDNTALLDGFEITAGNANASNPTDYPNHEGGGMYNNGGSPIVANIEFLSNAATEGGGGMWNQSGSSPTVTNVVFLNNSAPYGGAMYNTGLSNPTITNVTFDSNTASGSFGGGAMLNDGGAAPHISNVTFTFNSASSGQGGAMANQDGAAPVVENTTFYTNSAGSYGGAVYNTFTTATFTNASFSGNTAVNSGNGLYNDQAAVVTVDDSILWADGAPEIANVAGGLSTINDSVLQGGCPLLGSTCSNIHTSDPLLASPAFNGGMTKSMAIGAGSSALDAGNDGTCIPTDQRGVTRSLQGPHCDIGSYEHEYADILYATQSGPASGWCDSWAAGCQLSWAMSIAVSGEQIWVKSGGPHFPTATADRGISFNLKNGVQVYGGFLGTETLLSQRDPKAHATLLSGAIGSLLTRTDNSYHVVTAIGVNNTAVLDGFLVGDGYADGGSVQNNGGSIYTTGSPTLRNLVIGGSHAASFGGGLYNDSGSPSLTNVTFVLNTANLGGGGMYNNSGAPGLTNVTFSDNDAGMYGGGMENDFSGVTLLNVTFNSNSAGTGGGAMDNFNSNVTIRDSILWDDSGGPDPEILNASSTVAIDHSIVKGSNGSGGSWVTALGTDGGGNLDADPRLAPLSTTGGPAWTMALMSASAAMDTGNDLTCDGHDARAIKRPRGVHCDMGAYERIPPFSDYDPDGASDVVVFEKATGNWFAVTPAAGLIMPALNFGNDTNYIPVPGDYDGDTQTDPAVFEKATGNWFVAGSTAGFLTPALGFGNDTNYIPVPGDYDGDGKTDPAVFERSTGNWFVVGSTVGFFAPALAFGNDANYIPVQGDYDGDGKTDPAVFEKATGNWFVVGSTAGFFTPALGFGNDTNYRPVQADYDGDGKTDPGVFEKATGNWFVVGSMSGFMTPALGFGNDPNYRPQPGDYDGDAKVDAAVFEKATGNWFVIGSTAGFMTPALGFGNDTNYIPVVALSQ